MSSIINKFFKFSFFFFVLFLISFSLVSCTKGNDGVEVASLEYKANGDGTSTVIGIGNYFSEDLVIPEKDNNGNTVTTIANEAFYQTEDKFLSSTYRIKSVKIANTVTYIGEHAFYGNSDIKTLKLPQNDNLFIGEYAFSELAITQVVMPQNFYWKSTITSNPKIFYGCSKLIEIYCLKKFDLKDSNSIKEYVFGVDSNTVIHQSLDEESIIDYSNSDYVSCKIDDNYYLLDYNMDDNYRKTKITKDITLPAHINYKGRIIDSYSIHSGCFMFNSTISCVGIPNTVTEIGNRSFYSCRNLKYINIPNSIKTIGNEAFRECVSLYSITIPNSVVGLGDGAFVGCKNLSYVNVDASIDELPRRIFASCKVEYLYLTNNISVLDQWCFGGCEMKNLIINDSVKIIGAEAFMSCKNLEYVYIPKSVTNIIASFDDCTLLKELEYEGTKEEWNQIDSDLEDSYIRKIICSDGIIELEK